ncbi:MAG: PIN domain-containing protein [Acidimicrobiia bacterium]
MAGPVAVLDADVLVPILSCDLLLTAFDHDLYQPIVTPKILDEVERSLLRSFPHLDPDVLRRRVEQMRQALALHTRDDIDGGDALEGINPKDRHVVAAALAGDADVVVTNDRRLRREIEALDEPLRSASADDFAVSLLGDDRDAIEQVLDELVTKRVRRRVTRDALLDPLARAFPSFVAALDPSR